MRRPASFVVPPPASVHTFPAKTFQSSSIQSHRFNSLTRIHAAPSILRNICLRTAPFPATTATAFLVALLLGYLLGKRSTQPVLLDRTAPVQPIELSQDGVTPVWLNYGFRKLWSLVKKNTKQFAQEAIQPVIDDTDKPDFVKDVRIVQYAAGKRHPSFEIYDLFRLVLLPSSSVHFKHSFDPHPILPLKSMLFYRINKTIPSQFLCL